MRVLLIQSYLGKEEPAVFPIGLACLKPFLVNHEVRVFDMNTASEPFEELPQILADFGPEIVGISLRNIDSTNKRKVVFYYTYTKEIIRMVKSKTGARVVVGGSGFSMFASEIMHDEPDIDYGVYLEGEFTLSELMDNLDNPEKVKSVYYRKNRKVVFSGDRSYCSFRKLKPPDVTTLPIEDYHQFKDALGVETKRGCGLSCVYCVYGFLNGNHYRLKDPALVADEIETFCERHGAKRFTFIDSVFNIPFAHADKVLQEMIRRNLKIKWSAWFSEKNLTKPFLELAQAAGCDHVIFSPDGFDDKTLIKLGKNIRRKDILEGFRLLREFDGFEISYNFFKNPPGQNWSNFFHMVVFCVKAKLNLKNRVHFEFNSMRIEPHTRLYQIALDEKVVGEGDNLLLPKYYTNRKTWLVEKLFNAVLRLIGK